ncbi:MAG: HD domain-containing protein, partial [Anaerolineales bacterium]|nr:HD domain-containing protein [Anaerolineales bacterium]
MPSIENARSWYPEIDPVHGFDYILRVYRMAERLARTEEADLEIVRAAALLHDAQGSQTEGGEEGRHDHHHASSEFARQILENEGWTPDKIAAVQHCIRAHRFRDNTEVPQTLEAKILFDADKLDVIGAVGVARTIAFDVVVNQPIYAEPSEQFLTTGDKEPGEPHS